ncbi:hypothetical protein [Bacillus sp. FJAT-28004]|uniref:hypothetical protein n=1 Tax=Bacillus sp. FJAT-28004 TaxID=1679165 RepID=UPI0006B586E3|nr:hypothetical protein [Bacillus sp. FJAT-28004]
MKRAKAITAGAIALTLTLGGGGLWASQYVNATAASSDTQQEQGTQAENNAAKKDHEGRHGGFGRGFEQIQEQLLTYLGLDEAALQTKLQTLTLTEVAAESGKTRTELKAKLVEWLEAAEAVNPKPDAEADKLAETGKQLVKPDAAALAEKLLDSKGIGFGKQGGGGERGGGFEKNIEGIAAALGITADVLKAELESGKTVAAIAAEKGVAIGVIIDLQVKDKKAKLAEELAAGTITQEQYDTKLAEAVQHATEHVNGEMKARGGHGKGGPGGKGPRGARPSSDAAKSESTTDASAAATPTA